MEFLAALITCETFAPFCKGQITELSLDNFSAKVWLDTSRCPRFPYDRCAQGLHILMLSNSMKIQTRWVPSEENTLPDYFSRSFCSRQAAGHVVSGHRMLKVKPIWLNVTKFL